MDALSHTVAEALAAAKAAGYRVELLVNPTLAAEVAEPAEPETEEAEEPLTEELEPVEMETEEPAKAEAASRDLEKHT